MHKLVRMISQCVKAKPLPAVMISGGPDSCIILHHLNEKVKEPIYTYTFGIKGDNNNEFEDAERVAKHYETRHTPLLIENTLNLYREVLPLLPEPRYSIWIAATIQQAASDGRRTCYIGEGADEHFGGYWYKPKKSYIEQWTGLLTWGLPTYKMLFNAYNMAYEAPFMYLDWRATFRYFDYEQHKRFLRRAYEEILPDFVVSRKKQRAGIDYYLLWKRELHKEFPNAQPETEQEIRRLLNIWVMKEWLRSR